MLSWVLEKGIQHATHLDFSGQPGHTADSHLGFRLVSSLPWLCKSPICPRAFLEIEDFALLVVLFLNASPSNKCMLNVEEVE